MRGELSVKMAETHKPIILCVDDEEIPLLLRKHVLQKAGYDVLTARSGQEALTMAKTSPVDLVLSDYLMPAMSGAELAAQVKANRPTLPVILLSGVNELPVDADIADAFISKTESPDTLCAWIAKHISSAEGNGQNRDS
jgi:CheY-like chemotaxis protein